MGKIIYENLSNEELCALLQKAKVESFEYHKIGETLLDRNYGLMHEIAKKFTKYISIDDSMQILRLKLFQSALNYKESLDVKFSTFASHCCYNELSNQTWKSTLVKISSVSQIISSFTKNFIKANNREPSKQELIEGLKDRVAEKTIFSILNSQQTVSLNKAIQPFERDSESLIELISENKDDSSSNYKINNINKALNYLSEQHIDLVDKIYFQGLTFQKLGDMEGVSKQNISNKIETIKKYLKILTSDEGIFLISKIDQYKNHARILLKHSKYFSLEDLISYGTGKITLTSLYNIFKIMGTKVLGSSIPKLYPENSISANKFLFHLKDNEQEFLKYLIIGNKEKLFKKFTKEEIKTIFYDIYKDFKRYFLKNQIFIENNEENE